MNNLFRVSLLLIIVFGLIACQKSNEKDQQVTIEFNSTGSDIEFTDAKVSIELYGTAKNVADNSATVIYKSIVDISKLPESLVIDWPKDDYKLIDNPPVQNRGEATFYFSIKIDVNNDGQLCIDDYRLDYDTTPLSGFSGAPNTTISATVTPIVAGDCLAFSDSNLDLQPFVKALKAANCADIDKSLYLIDQNMIFISREGSCPDNSYEQILYKNTLDNVLARRYDSIAGGQTEINDDSITELFNTLHNNKAQPQLGLDVSHKVTKIPLLLNSETDLAIFIEQATSASCVDNGNYVYLINNQYVYWHRSGNCPDNGYQDVLYKQGKAVDASQQFSDDWYMVAQAYDSIAGPQVQYFVDSEKALFDLLLNSTDKSQLVLPSQYLVSPISF